MLIDTLIVVMAIGAAIRGRGSGFVRQFCSAIGFFGGLFFGGWLQPHTLRLVTTSDARAIILIVTVMGSALIGLTLGEYAGLHLKLRFYRTHINKLDNSLGSVLSVLSLLVSVWLVASIVSGLPYYNIKTQIADSRIVRSLNQILPPAPDVISSLGHLIDPNGFPDVFIGDEPTPTQVNLPSLGVLANAVSADQASVLRIRGEGCGGIISGSGFVVGKDLVATNAHVVAGIASPYVQDSNHSLLAKVVWFDPNLDFALLRVNGLSEKSLTIASHTSPRGTAAAVLGYPGGGNFNAGPAAIMDEFDAVGHNIYGSGRTLRDVYEVQANIIPGNSGGPLIGTNGQVMGIVFAESTTYNHVGYALTTTQFSKELNQNANNATAVSTGSCAE